MLPTALVVSPRPDLALDLIQAHTRATAQTAVQFLETPLHRMPFPIRALQVDGGSAFAAEFDRTRTGVLSSCCLFPAMKKLNHEWRQWENI